MNTDHINMVKETISPSGNYRHTTIVLSGGEYLSQLPIEKVMDKIYKATKEKCMEENKINFEDRLKEEYTELKKKYNNLHKTLIKLEAGTCDFSPKCSLELLKRQAKAMGEYLYTLELRAEVEGIEL
jgi:hypothetical protein